MNITFRPNIQNLLITTTIHTLLLFANILAAFIHNMAELVFPIPGPSQFKGSLLNHLSVWNQHFFKAYLGGPSQRSFQLADFDHFHVLLQFYLYFTNICQFVYMGFTQVHNHYLAFLSISIANKSITPI